MKKLILVLLIVPVIGLSQSNFIKAIVLVGKKATVEKAMDVSLQLFQHLQVQEVGLILMKMVMQED